MTTVPKRVLDFWDAIDRIDPLPDSWSESAQICTQIEKLVTVTAASHGVEYEPLGYDKFMPPRWIAPPKEKKREKLSAEEEIQLLNQAFDR